MVQLDTNTLKKARELGAAAMQGGQDQAPGQSPSPDDLTLGAPEFPDPPRQAAPDPAALAARQTFVTRRNDLIQHGGESLTKILTEKKYAGIRADFGLGSAEEYKAKIDKLDHDSRNTLKGMTLRDVASLTTSFIAPDPNTASSITIQDATLKYALTPAGDAQGQVEALMGAKVLPYEQQAAPSNGAKAAKADFDAALSSLKVKHPPRLYITNDNKPSAVNTYTLKDGTPIVVLNENKWDGTEKDAQNNLKNVLTNMDYDHTYDIMQVLKKEGMVSISDVVTNPKYAAERQMFDLPDLSGAKAGDWEKLSSLSKSALKELKLVHAYIDMKNGDPVMPYFFLDKHDHEGELKYYFPELNNGATAMRIDPTKLDNDEAKQFYANYADMSVGKDKMHLPQVPELYLFSDNISGSAVSFRFQDGTLAIAVGDKVANLDTPEAFAILGHEDGHFHGKDYKPKKLFGIIPVKMTPQDFINRESRADNVGAGPRGACSPEAMREGMAELMDIGTPEKMQRQSEDYLNQLAFGTADHPEGRARLAALDAEGEQPMSCKPYYPMPPKQDAKAEPGKSR